MPHDVLRYLSDIRSACTRIETYTLGLEFESYAKGEQVRDSVERCLEIIGEAVRQLIHHHPELASLFPDAQAIIGLRNILSHEYGEVDDARVWWAVQHKVPELLVRVENEIKRRQSAEEK